MSSLRKSLLLTLEFPPQKGGTQKYYFDICRGLPNDKIVVLALKISQKSSCIAVRDKSQKSSNDVNFRIYRKNLLISYLYPHWLPMAWHLWRIIKKEKIELIQVGQVLPCGTAVLIINKLFKIPYIIYTHGLDILGPKEGTRKQKLMKLILTEAEKVVSNSEFVKNEVIKLGIERNKVAVVYPGVNPPNPPCQGGISKSPPDKWGWGVAGQEQNLRQKYNLQNKKILLTVCRLVDRKGVDLVICALKALRAQKGLLEPLVYVVVGDGLEKKRLEKLSEEFSVKIIFTGRINDEELMVWYQMGDVFILTPKKSEDDVEGFGIVYLEANSYGKPVIGSRMSGIIEAVEDGVSGILVEPDNIEEIGQAIIKLFNDDELRERLGRQGRERVEREFGVEKQMKKLKELLSKK